MRISPAKLLIVIALCLVVLVEARTILAFFDVEVSVLEIALVGVVAITALVVWAVRPADEETSEP
ncbi:CbaC protein [Natrarchaeobius oligotrophus]|uniref:CbaC protein n=1 Tax=Natrarchaeobius chitinivorans TaxID=1679083 RepID=A0A3N6PSJ4_NATCH|nr:CbaC protein [Natrarchaeobius chitinivorans]RQH02506.1 CbaC protein [Natrarchaeobius chitinivorans]